MTRTPPAPIRTRPDGSIDTAHYIARGRRARSHAAMEMLRPARTPARPRPRGLLAACTALLALLWLPGGR